MYVRRTLPKHIRDNDLNAIEEVIRNGEKVRSHDLETAMMHNRFEVIQILMKHAHVDNYLLSVTIQAGKKEALRMFLQSPHIVRKEDYGGMPVLTFLIQLPMDKEEKDEYVDMLLGSVVKDDINEVDRDGMTALSHALKNTKDEDMVKKLIGAGADLHMAIASFSVEKRDAFLKKFGQLRSPGSVTRAQTVISRVMRSRLKSLETASMQCETYLINAPDDLQNALYEYVASGHTVPEKVPDFRIVGAMTLMPASPFESESGAMIRLSDVFLKMFQLIEGAPPRKSAMKLYRSMALDSFRRDRAAQVVQAHPVSTTTHSSFAIEWHYRSTRECCLFEISVPQYMPVLGMCIPSFMRKSQQQSPKSPKSSPTKPTKARQLASQILRNEQFEMLLSPCSFKVTGERKVKLTMRNHPGVFEVTTPQTREMTLIQVEAKPVTVHMIRDVQHPEFANPMDVLYIPRHLSKKERALVTEWCRGGKIPEVVFHAPPSSLTSPSAFVLSPTTYASAAGGAKQSRPNRKKTHFPDDVRVS